MKLLDTLRNNIDYRNHIIGRERYFNSSVLVALCNIDNTPHFVLQKRAKQIRQGGEISFPGGRFEESDKTFLNTAIRETSEELGILEQDIEPLGKIGTLIIPTGVLVEAYLGFLHIKNIEDFNINKDEVEKLLFVPVEYFKTTKPRIEKVGMTSHPYYFEDGIEKVFPAKELNLPDIYHKPWNSKPRSMNFFFYEGETIWGITAEILIETIKILNDLNKI